MENRIKKQTFSQSIFSLFVSQVVVKVLGLFYRLYLTNRKGFGDEGNAIANCGYQVFALALSIVAIGIPTAISKLIAEYMGKGQYRKAYKIFKISLVLFSIIGLAGSYALYCWSGVLAKNYLHVEEARLSIIVLSPSVFLVSVISVFKGFFSGRQSINLTAKAQSIDQFVKTISTIIMIEISIVIANVNTTEIMAAYSNLAATLGNLFELVFLYRAYMKEMPSIKREIINNKEDDSIRIKNAVKQISVVAIPLSLTALIMTISKNIDSMTIVNSLKDIIGYEESKRQYGILSGKVDSLISFPLSFNMAIVTALLPAIASNEDNNKEQKKRIKQSLILGLTIATSITFIYFVFSNSILKLLFPNASEGGEILRISSLQIVFITIEQITNTILNGLGKNMIPIKAITLGVIAKGILNIVLVPRIDLWCGGTNGAAISTLVCHVIASLISSVYIIKEYRNKNKLIANI